MSTVQSVIRNLDVTRDSLSSSSSAVGIDAEKITDALIEIEGRQTLDRPHSKLFQVEASAVAEKPISEKLFDSLASAKLLTTQVAMHLDVEWRDRVFEQLDDLLAPEDWHEDDEPLGPASFRTFLRMIIFHHPTRRPGFGQSNRGNLIAAWTTGSDRLTIEFLPKDKLRWVLSCEVDGENEHAAGETPVRRLMDVLAPYNPARWFDNAAQ